MNDKQIKEIIKKEIAPLLIGIRNDLEVNKKALDNVSEELKKKSTLEYDLEIDDNDYKGEKGDTPTDDHLLKLITPLIPKRGKEYFTDTDISNIVQSVRDLLPRKEDLKGENGNDGVIDYSTVKDLAMPIIKAKYDVLKGEIDILSKALQAEIKKDKSIDVNKLAKQIRDIWETYKGSDRLDAKAIKGLENYVQTFISTSTGGGGGSSTGGGIQSIVAGTNITVDDTDPANPIVASLADRYKTTSTTSQAIVSTGILTFTVDADLAYTPQQDVIIAYDVSNHMHGTVVSYSGTTLVVDIQNKTGSGTYASWVINLDGIAPTDPTPAGANTEVQFNDNGVFGADSDFRYMRDVETLDVFSTYTERVTNGNFTGNATGWTLASGWAYSANSVSHTSNGTGTLSQAIAVFNGGYFKITFTITNLTVGSVSPAVGGTTLTTRSANGTYTEYFRATNSSALVFTPTNTSRFTIDSVSVVELSGGNIQSGNIYTRELVIGKYASNSYPGTTRHISLKNLGSASYIDAYFGSTLGGAIKFDSSQNISVYAGSSGSFQWYNGLGSPALSAYLTSYIFTHYGVIAAGGSVAAGNQSSTQPSTMTSWGSLGLKHTIITANTTLTASYTYVDVFPDQSATCTGSPTYACSHWTTQTDCELRDSHGGCSWSVGSCDTYNGNQSGCTSQTGCTWETGSCSSFGDEFTCTSYTGCSWANNPVSCSVYDTDESSCSSTFGCTWNYTDCASSFYDESSCNSQSGCSWDSMSSVCSGSYNTSCSGSYDQYSCTGSYDTGNCTGTYGNCIGTSNCGGIDDNTNCSGESGCSLATGVTLTMPSDSSFSTNLLRTYFIRNIGSTGSLYVIPNTSQTVNGGSSLSIGAGKARHLSLAYHIIACNTWDNTDSTTCTSGHTGCTWTGCSALDEATCSTTGGQCSWDADNSVCTGVGNCSGTWSAIRDWSVYGGVF